MRASTRIYRKLIYKIVPPKLIGWFDFTFRREAVLDEWGGPLNGQRGRQKAVRELFGKIDFCAVVETGTFRGSSTGFFHELGECPVWTVEKEQRFASFARLRFREKKGISVHCGDSRAFLKELISSGTIPQSGPVFFYLDAHWGADLPLLAELDLIYSRWPDAVVMVDDFQVPDDGGYKHDSYGEEACLNVDLVSRMRGGMPACFFPALHSSEENGARSGSVVLAWDSDQIQRIRTCPSLRQWSR